MKNINISLVGFMGAGKSAVAKKLADVLKREIVSTDEEIVKKESRSIINIFEQDGEHYFRKVEKDCIEELSKKNDLIIDCGGGVVIDPENISNLKKNGIVVYLKTSPDVILERTKGCKNRPLLQVEDPLSKIKELLEKRTPHYMMADCIVETDGKSIDGVCREIVELVK